MNCERCNQRLTSEEEMHKDKDGTYTCACFECLYGDSPGEDDSLEDDEWWGNVWPDQE